ncbi:MAG: HD domain-containing protein [Nitrospirae bacterium]|nr:HD domain-containing protein [Nitrospirota bacterium]
MESHNILNDLRATVKELGNVYEEISLLYKLSERFSTLNVKEICENLVDEAVATVGVKTASVLFFNEGLRTLYTRACKGDWEKDRVIDGEVEIISNALEYGKPVAFCNLGAVEHENCLSGLGSVLLCPLLGKGKTIGLMVLADKSSEEEFYSNDIKLLMVITRQAAMAIENAFLYEEIEDLLLGTIKSFVKALETTTQWTAGHTERVTMYTQHIAAEMGLDGKQTERLKICSLLHDIGKIAIPRDILNKKGKLEEDEWIEIRNHPLVGAKILSGLKAFDDILDGIRYHHEHWDGTRGLFGLKGDDIPLMSRILAVADAFDAMTSDRPYRPRKNRNETLKEILELSGKQFDPSVVEAFYRWFNRQHQAFLP